MKKNISFILTGLLLINITTSLNAVENKKPSDNLSFVQMNEKEYIQEYENYKNNWYNENYVDSLNKWNEYILGKDYQSIELSDIEIDKTYKKSTFLLPLSNDFLDSKESFLKEYNLSSYYTWETPIKDKKNQYEYLEINYSCINSEGVKIMPEAYVSKTPYESNKDRVIKVINDNTRIIKEGSKAYFVEMQSMGLICLIISDKIDYVVKLDNSFKYKRVGDITNAEDYDRTELNKEEIVRVNELADLKDVFVTVEDIKLLHNAYVKSKDKFREHTYTSVREALYN